MSNKFNHETPNKINENDEAGIIEESPQTGKDSEKQIESNQPEIFGEEFDEYDINMIARCDSFGFESINKSDHPKRIETDSVNLKPQKDDVKFVNSKLEVCSSNLLKESGVSSQSFSKVLKILPRKRIIDESN